MGFLGVNNISGELTGKSYMKAAGFVYIIIEALGLDTVIVKVNVLHMIGKILGWKFRTRRL